MKIIKYIVLFIFTFITSLFSQSQFDTLTVMQYNLMRYGSASLGISCTPPTYIDRANYLKTIIGFVLPDVLAVEEIEQGSSTYPQYLLANAMNQDGRTYYKRAPYNSQIGDDITNMLYYNSNVLSLTGQFTIGCSPRDAHAYRLKYTNPTKSDDTTSFVFIVAHYKSSNTVADANVRGVCANNIMNYLKNNFSTTGNYFLLGDFNLYSNTEPAWQNMTSSTLSSAIRMYDPINQVGAWSNNAAYQLHHTQSTRVTSANCFSGGGMDDRFDFILSTNNVVSSTIDNKVKYIPASYKAVGNDGLRFNGNIYDANDPNSNASVPADVALALYNMSDHLPVRLKLQVSLEASNTTASITSFTLQGGFVGTISGNNISINVPNGVSISSLTASGVLADLHSVSPSFESILDYSQPVSFTVTSQNLSKTIYSVAINRTTGLNQKQLEAINQNNISFANPAHTNSLLFSFDFTETLEVSMIDNLGKKQLSTTISNQSTIDISNIPNGFYHLIFSDKVGNIYTNKIIIEKE